MKKTLQNKALLSRGLQWISLRTPGQMGLPDDGPLDKFNFVGGVNFVNFATPPWTNGVGFIRLLSFLMSFRDSPLFGTHGQM